MIQFGMRAHDFSAPKPAKEFLNGLSNAGIRYVQLAFEKSFSDPTANVFVRRALAVSV